MMPPRPERRRLLRAALLLLTVASGGCAAHGDLLVPAVPPAHELRLPLAPGSLRFAVIGDSGTGGAAQRAVGRRMAEYHAVFPFELVLMLGDNIYGRDRPEDYRRKFEEPYAPLLAAGVTFQASLGNHDRRRQRFYAPFNMGGRTYYSFRPDGHDVRFFALESDALDAAQLEWLERELREATEAWKIAFFHHPLYSSGRRHGSDRQLRALLEPLFIRYGVRLVFSGHEHFYERLVPQQGVAYFISGAAGKLRRGNVRADSPLTAAHFDRDHSFMLVEIAGDELHFQAISRTGETVDAGTVSLGERPRETERSQGGQETTKRDEGSIGMSAVRRAAQTSGRARSPAAGRLSCLLWVLCADPVDVDAAWLDPWSGLRFNESRATRRPVRRARGVRSDPP